MALTNMAGPKTGHGLMIPGLLFPFLLFIANGLEAHLLAPCGLSSLLPFALPLEVHRLAGIADLRIFIEVANTELALGQVRTELTLPFDAVDRIRVTPVHPLTVVCRIQRSTLSRQRTDARYARPGHIAAGQKHANDEGWYQNAQRGTRAGVLKRDFQVMAEAATRQSGKCLPILETSAVHAYHR